ncbi:DUF3258 domain-containing protein [Serratia marcescens]|nr:DUF3258 domain-containing protein [Serratia marcescens]
MRRLTQNDIDIFLLELQQEIYEEAYKTKSESRTAVISGSKTISINEGLLFSEFIGQHLDEGFYNGARPFSEDYITTCLSSQFDVAGMENQLMEASIQYDYFLKLWQDARKAFFSKRLKDYGDIVESLKPIQKNTNALLTTVSPEDEFQVGKQVTLTDAWSDFVKYKSSWTDKTRQINEKYFEAISIVLGKDTPIVDVSKLDIKRLLEAIEGLPKQNKKPYNKMTVQECLDLDDIPESDLVSSKTVKDYLKLCQSFFSAFLTKEKDILRSSPTDNVQFVFKSKPYGDYTGAEMKCLVRKFLSESNWKKWVFLLLAYTGARRAEITSLTARDVLFDDDSGRFYLMIHESKTAAGTRQIPLHNFLINNGFIDFVKSKGDSALFPEITYQNQVTKIFHSIRDELGIPYLNDFREPRVVHSLRHTFITSAMANSNTILVQQVVGHELSNIGETKRYTHRATVSELLRVVDSIEWL